MLNSRAIYEVPDGGGRYKWPPESLDMRSVCAL